MRPALRYVLAVAVVLAAIAIPVGISYYLSIRLERSWCATLNLLTSHPVPSPANPSANPSRVQTYEFYIDLVRQRDQYGC